jgi:hypothetical protein
MTVERASRILGCDPAQLAAIEDCLRSIPPHTLRYLLRYGYQVTDEAYVRYFGDLVEHGSQRGWTQRLDEQIPSYRDMYRGLDAGAIGTWMYSPTVIPSLFRTREYAATTVKQGWIDEPDYALTRFSGPDPLQVWTIIGEPALRARVGPPHLLARQYEHLLTIGALATVELLILPISAPANAGYPEPFTMLDYPSPPDDPGIVYRRRDSAAQFFDTPEEVGPFHVAYHRLATAALDRDESTEFLHTLLATSLTAT